MEEFTKLAELLNAFSKYVHASDATQEEKEAIKILNNYVFNASKIINQFNEKQQHYLYISHVFLVSYYYFHMTRELPQKKKSKGYMPHSFFLLKDKEDTSSTLKLHHAKLKEPFKLSDKLNEQVFNVIFKKEKAKSIEHLNNILAIRYEPFRAFASRAQLQDSTTSDTQRYDEILHISQICSLLAQLKPNYREIFKTFFAEFLEQYQKASSSGSHKLEAEALHAIYETSAADIQKDKITAVINLLYECLRTYYNISSQAHEKGIVFSSGSVLKKEIQELFKKLNIEEYRNRKSLDSLKLFLKTPPLGYSPIESLVKKGEKSLFFEQEPVELTFS